MSDRRVPDRDAAIALARSGALLTIAHMAAIWSIGRSQAHRKERAGAFDAFKVTPALGPKKFSGSLVARYLDGEPIFEPVRRPLRKGAA